MDLQYRVVLDVGQQKLVKVDFSSEVEYCLLRDCEQEVHTVAQSSSTLLQAVLRADLKAIVEFMGVQAEEEKGYQPRQPCGGVVGFGSECDREVAHIHAQVSAHAWKRIAAAPNVLLENVASNGLFPRFDPAPQRGTRIFNARVCTLDDLCKLHGWTEAEIARYAKEGSFEQDSVLIQEYYAFRGMFDALAELRARAREYQHVIHCLQTLEQVAPATPRGAELRSKIAFYSDASRRNKQTDDSLSQRLILSSFVQRRMLRLLGDPWDLKLVLELPQDLQKATLHWRWCKIDAVVREELRDALSPSGDLQAVIDDDLDDELFFELSESMVEGAPPIREPAALSNTSS